jgi:phospholipid/cholesterol/gamma-HCH transport system substrate-binding protein
MSQRVSRTKVGVFVLVGLLMALGSIVWLGAVRYLQGGQYYVTFFNESVQGLQRDSVVKYRGVDVGRVVDIRVAPDYKLIEVVMLIRFTGEPEKDLVAQLRSVGITGMVFVELDLKKPGEPDLSPRITFAAEYPIIPSRPSEISRIFSVIDKVSQQLGSIDFKGLADQMGQVLTAAHRVFDDQRLRRTMAHLERAAALAEKFMVRAEQVARELEVKGVVARSEQVLEQAGQAVTDLRGLIAQARQELAAMGLGRTGRKVEGYVTSLGDKSGEVLDQLQEIADSLRRASQSIEALARRLERSPSDLLFSRPPAPRGGEEEE